MNPPRSRRLVWSLALLLGLLQPLLASPARAIALLASHGHAHDVSVRADSGHVDLVLAHAASSRGERHGAERHLHASPVSEETHVVHLASSDAGRESSRRTADAPAAALAWHAPRSAEPAAPPAAAGARLALAPALARSVVLRI